MTEGTLEVSTADADGFIFLTVFPDQEFSRDDSGIIDGPGTFSLEIDANGVDYTVVVCQRADGAQTPEEDTPEDNTDTGDEDA